MLALLPSLALAACGGGGGGGASSAGSSGGTPPATTPSDFPVLVQSTDFNLAPLIDPKARLNEKGTQQGQVVLAAGAPAAAGLRVELLDTSDPSAPSILASTQTDANGVFSLSDVMGTAQPAKRWLRVSLPDGTVLRAYPTGWTQLSPGTEVAVSEIARLLKAGAFTAHVLTVADLASAQQSLDLVWLGSFGAQTGIVAVNAVRDFVRFHAPWNQLLDNLDLASPSVGAGDVAGLLPAPQPLGSASGVKWLSTVTIDGAVSSEIVNANCYRVYESSVPQCVTSVGAMPDAADNLGIKRSGIELFSIPSVTELPRDLVDEIGAIPVLEFPYVAGTTVLVNNPALIPRTNKKIHASVKITRRIYPAGPLQALGTSVQAIKVVLDYEISSLDTTTSKQVDMLVRESRWFAPQGGRVRVEASRVVRSDGKTKTTTYTVAANSISGQYFGSAAIPFAGTADVKALALRHRDAIYSEVVNRIYAAAEADGGQVLELEPGSLSTLRSIRLSALPMRLAVSKDGSRLYVGQKGGLVSEFSISDLSLTRSFMLPLDAYGQQYTEVRDLSVDPFDASRLLVLAGGGFFASPSGAVLTYRAGKLLLRDAPVYSAADYGWGAFYPTNIAWSTVQDEFLSASVISPSSLNRFRTNADGYTDLADLNRVDAVGWIDVGGEVVTSAGDILGARMLRTLHSLSLAPWRITQCNRFDADSDLCSISDRAFPSPYLVRMDHGNSGFLGAYRPISAQPVVTGCVGSGGQVDSLGFDGFVLAAMGNGRSLARTLPVDQGIYCSLQVWTLHGVGP